MINKAVLFVLSFIIWMLVGWPFDLQHAFAGVFVAGIVVFLTANLFKSKPKHFFQVKRYLWFVYFAIIMLWECLKANLAVAAVVLNPGYSLSPGIVIVKTKLKSATGLSFLANSITMAPGAITVDIKPQDGILYVHCADAGAQGAQAAQVLADKFERILKRIFEDEA